MSLRDWSDGSRTRRTWSFQLEFALATVFVAISLGLATTSAVWPAAVSAHPGGLAADGCHNDRKEWWQTLPPRELVTAAAASIC